MVFLALALPLHRLPQFVIETRDGHIFSEHPLPLSSEMK
jgi:hypothetical protein